MLATAQPGGIAGIAVSVMDALGAVGAGLLVAAENIFPPIPSELILPLAGFTAARGSLNLGAVIVCATLGSVLGALVLYAIGAALGRDRTRRFMAALPLVNPADVDRTENFFDRRGSFTVFFGRMIPIFRSLISIPAGVTRMPLPRFVALTAAGSFLWNCALILAGYYLGENWHIVEDYVGVASYVIAGLVLLLILVWILTRLRNRQSPTTEK